MSNRTGYCRPPKPAQILAVGPRPARYNNDYISGGINGRNRVPRTKLGITGLFALDASTSKSTAAAKSGIEICQSQENHTYSNNAVYHHRFTSKSSF